MLSVLKVTNLFFFFFYLNLINLWIYWRAFFLYLAKVPSAPKAITCLFFFYHPIYSTNQSSCQAGFTQKTKRQTKMFYSFYYFLHIKSYPPITDTFHPYLFQIFHHPTRISRIFNQRTFTLKFIHFGKIY